MSQKLVGGFVLFWVLWVGVDLLEGAGTPGTHFPPSATSVSEDTAINPAWNSSVFEDPSGLLTIEDVIRKHERGEFRPYQEQALNFGITHSTWWIHLHLSNPTPNQAWWLEVGYPQLDEVDFYQTMPDGSHSHYQSGDSRPLSVRPTKNRRIAFPLQFPPDGETTIFLQVRNASTMVVPLLVRTPSDLFSSIQLELLLSGLFYGVFIFITLYAFSDYFVLRQPAYLHIGLYVFAFLVYLAGLQGLPYQYIWPGFPALSNIVFIVAFFLLMAFFSLFARRNLWLRIYAPSWDRATFVLVFAFVLMATSPLWLDQQTIFKLLHIAALVGLVFVLGAGFVSWWRGYREAWVFLLSIATLVLVAVVAQMSSLSILRTNRIVQGHFHLALLAQAFVYAYGKARLSRQWRDETEGHQIELERWKTLAQIQESPMAVPVFKNQGLRRIVQEDVPLWINTLGRFEIWRDGRLLHLPARGETKHLHLLKLLIVFGGKDVSQQVVMDELWPEIDGDRAYSNLRTTLFRLRQFIGEEVVHFDRGLLTLNSDVCGVDALAFESALSNHVPQQQIEPILSHYLGDLFPDSEGAPILGKREKLRDLFGHHATVLAQAYCDEEAFQEAFEFCRICLEASPLHEGLVQIILQCAAQNGQHQAGREIFHAFAAALAKEKGVDPAVKTLDLARDLGLS